LEVAYLDTDTGVIVRLEIVAQLALPFKVEIALYSLH
jgi:hypothetical protein